MAILTTGNTFSTGQQVTANSLNAAVNSAAFAAGAIDTATMQFVGTNDQIGIKDLGVSTSKIAALAVTGAKIAETTITPTKLSAGAPAWTETTLTVANRLDFAPANSTATAGTYGRAATTGLITVSMTAHGMVTGNVALLDFSENAGVAATDGSYAITRIDDNSFTVVDTVASPTAIAAGTVVSRTNYYGNATIRGSATVAGALSVTGALSVAGSEIKQLTSATALSPTSGLVLDFTIPSYVKRISVTFVDLSHTGGTVVTSDYLIQLIDSSVQSSGYVNSYASTSGGSNTSTAGFIQTKGSQATTAATLSGCTVLYKHSGNTWFSCGNLLGNLIPTVSHGSKTLSSSITGLRITTVGGTINFDAGSVNIMYE